MSWLEDSREEMARRIHEALEVASLRNDDLALRRVWSRISEMLPPPGPGPERRRRWPFVLLTLGTIGGVGIGGMLLWPAMFQRRPGSVPGATGTAGRAAPPPVVATTDKPTWSRASGTSATSATSAATTAGPPPPRSADIARPAQATEAGLAPLTMGPTFIRTRVRESRTLRLLNGARIDLRAHSTMTIDAGQRPALRRGKAWLEVPKQPQGEPFSVAAGPYVVVVVGTKFSLGVSSRGVEVEVREGSVQVWRDGEMVRIAAGDSWKGPVRRDPVGREAMARVASGSQPAGQANEGGPGSRKDLGPDFNRQHPADAYREAMAALARGDSMIALGLLREASQGSGPAAENAGFAIGTVLRDHLHQRRQAAEAWSRYRERFPSGLLRQETDLNIIQTLVDLGESGAARLEIEAFLRLHPDSERYREMAALGARLVEAPRPTSQSGPSGSGAGRGSGGVSAMRDY